MLIDTKSWGEVTSTGITFIEVYEIKIAIPGNFPMSTTKQFTKQSLTNVTVTLSGLSQIHVCYCIFIMNLYSHFCEA